MEIATLSSKGQITIPKAVRKALGLECGDKIVIQQEDNGRFYFDNAALVVFSRAADDFKGAAKKAGFKNESQMQDYMKGIRKKVRGY